MKTTLVLASGLLTLVRAAEHVHYGTWLETCEKFSVELFDRVNRLHEAVEEIGESAKDHGLDDLIKESKSSLDDALIACTHIKNLEGQVKKEVGSEEEDISTLLDERATGLATTWTEKYVKAFKAVVDCELKLSFFKAEKGEAYAVVDFLVEHLGPRSGFVIYSAIVALLPISLGLLYL